MPVYPFLQSLFYDTDMTDEQFFTEGKYRNLLLSVVLLTVIGVILANSFGLSHSVILTLITTFTVFMFKAGYFQTEVLFYFLSIVCFLLFWHLLRNPSQWRLAVHTGVVVGITHLTKASILPALLLFLLVRLTWSTTEWWRSARRPNRLVKNPELSR